MRNDKILELWMLRVTMLSRKFWRSRGFFKAGKLRYSMTRLLILMARKRGSSSWSSKTLIKWKLIWFWKRSRIWRVRLKEWRGKGQGCKLLINFSRWGSIHLQCVKNRHESLSKLSRRTWTLRRCKQLLPPISATIREHWAIIIQSQKNPFGLLMTC